MEASFKMPESSELFPTPDQSDSVPSTCQNVQYHNFSLKSSQSVTRQPPGTGEQEI